jgi:hypothetical protein
MRMASTACTVLVSLGLFFPPCGARSQTSTTASPSNAGSVKTEMVPSLIVLNAGGRSWTRRYIPWTMWRPMPSSLRIGLSGLPDTP